MTRFAWSCRIGVTDHALERARQLVGWDDRTRIRADVRAALLNDRVTAVQPNWTRGDGTDGETTGVEYAYDEDATRCWVLGARADGSAYVKTLLIDVQRRIALSEERRLRTGTRRR